jgi:RNA polymerase subunit RPABC4/transcription elongation factor Spt4
MVLCFGYSFGAQVVTTTGALTADRIEAALQAMEPAWDTLIIQSNNNISINEKITIPDSNFTLMIIADADQNGTGRVFASSNNKIILTGYRVNVVIVNSFETNPTPYRDDQTAVYEPDYIDMTGSRGELSTLFWVYDLSDLNTVMMNSNGGVGLRGSKGYGYALAKDMDLSQNGFTFIQATQPLKGILDGHFTAYYNKASAMGFNSSKDLMYGMYHCKKCGRESTNQTNRLCPVCNINTTEYPKGILQYIDAHSGDETDEKYVGTIPDLESIFKEILDSQAKDGFLGRISFNGCSAGTNKAFTSDTVKIEVTTVGILEDSTVTLQAIEDDMWDNDLNWKQSAKVKNRKAHFTLDLQSHSSVFKPKMNVYFKAQVSQNGSKKEFDNSGIEIV